MCGTTDSSFQSSNTLNNTGVWSLIELASLYTVPLSAMNVLNCLTTTGNGQARPIQKANSTIFESALHFWIQSSQIESYGIRIRMEFRSFEGPYSTSTGWVGDWKKLIPD